MGEHFYSQSSNSILIHTDVPLIAICRNKYKGTIAIGEIHANNSAFGYENGDTELHERTKTRSFNIRGEIRSVINKLDTQTPAVRESKIPPDSKSYLRKPTQKRISNTEARRSNYRRFVSHSWHVALRIDDARKISPRTAPSPGANCILSLCSPNLAVYSGFAASFVNAAFARRPLLPLLCR